MPHEKMNIAVHPFCRRGGSIRFLFLLAVCFALGASVAVLWFQMGGKRSQPAETALAGLNEVTRAALENLDSPVEIRFYSLLDPASVSESTRQFAERVNALLSRYEAASGGKIKFTRFNNVQDDAKAASADGLRAFNLDKGDACYLGMAVVHGQQKEIFRELAPEWEAALGYDISRAVVQVSTPPPRNPGQPSAQSIDPAVMAEVRLAITNLESVSVEQAEKQLRLSAYEDFSQAVKQMERERKAAEERLKSAQQGNSEAERQAASENLRQLQAAQTEKLKEIAAKSQAQINALQQMKAGK